MTDTFQDAAGNPVKGPGGTKWSTSNPVVANIDPATANTEVTDMLIGGPGTCVITVSTPGLPDDTLNLSVAAVVVPVAVSQKIVVGQPVLKP